MKKLLLTLAMAGLFGSAVSATPYGIFFSSTKEPVSASSLGSYSKTASGTTHSILSMVAMGDASIEEVAKSAGITKIKHIDKETTTWPLFVYHSEKFTIYGD